MIEKEREREREINTHLVSVSSHTHTHTHTHAHTHTHTHIKHTQMTKWKERTCRNGYHHRKWYQWSEFKFSLRLYAFHFAQRPLGNALIILFSLHDAELTLVRFCLCVITTHHLLMGYFMPKLYLFIKLVWFIFLWHM